MASQEVVVNSTIEQSMKDIRTLVEKKGWAIHAYKPEEGILAARTPRRLFSSGEEILIRVRSHNEGSIIGIVSTPTAQLVDWGRCKIIVQELASNISCDKSVPALPATPHRRRSRATYLIPVAVVLGMGVFFPFEKEVAPAKEVLVVDEEQRPVAGASVQQWWRHYAVESTGNEETQVTGKDGYAKFPRRIVRASLIAVCLGTIRNYLTSFVHASYGPSEGTLVWFDGYGRDRNGFSLTQSEELPPALENGITKQKVIIRPRR